MKVLFLDHDGVMCLLSEYASRYNKCKKVGYHPSSSIPTSQLPLSLRYDNFNNKAVKTLNQIIEATNCEIVVTSTWRLHATVTEMGEFYRDQGVNKIPIGFTPPIRENMYQHKKSRVNQIMIWLSHHPEVTHWVAVDDMSLDQDERMISFVLADELEGIGKAGIKKKIIQHLTGDPTPPTSTTYYTTQVQQLPATAEMFIELPRELLNQLDWKLGDEIKWVLPKPWGEFQSVMLINLTKNPEHSND